ncbi:hypothetical protein O1L55_32770 [Streptomyces albulus]|nr:hypothetical protein [Streptomyces noursei]
MTTPVASSCLSIRVAVGTLTSAWEASLLTASPSLRTSSASGSRSASCAMDSPAEDRPTVAVRDRRMA